jgi:hypothetical protein
MRVLEWPESAVRSFAYEHGVTLESAATLLEARLKSRASAGFAMLDDQWIGLDLLW